MGLDPARFQTGVCALASGGLLEEELSDKGIPHWILNKRLGLDLSVLPRLRKLLRTWKPDIVHTFLFTANTFGRVAAIATRAPVIIATEHNCDPRDIGRVAIDRVLARFTDRIIVVTKPIEEHVIKHHWVSKKKVVLIDEGIDFSQFPPKQLRQEHLVLDPARKFIVGIVGRLEPQKAHHVFVRAMASVMAAHREVEAWILGEGSLRGELERSAAASGLPGKFRFLGFRTDLAAVLHSLDLFVVSSEYEGLPIALLNAVACKVPFVSTRVGAIPELFLDKIHGRLVPAGDDRKLAECIAWSLKHYDCALEMAERARTTILERFCAEKMMKRHEELYASLLRADSSGKLAHRV